MKNCGLIQYMRFLTESCKVLMALVVLVIVAARTDADAAEFKNHERLGARQGLTTNYVSRVEQDNRGVTWIGTDAGLFSFDGHSFRQYTHENSGLSGHTVSALYHDKGSDKLWVGTKSGICRIDCKSRVVETDILPADAGISNVAHIFSASDGGIWIINHYNRIIHLDQHGASTIYDAREISGLPGNFTSAVDDGRGHLVIAHNYEGISVLDIADRKVRNFCYSPEVSNGIPRGTIHSVFIDSHKNIWLGSNHGLSLFIPERGEFHTFLHDQSNPNSIASDHVFTIFEDSTGLVWVGCDMGRISIFNPGDLTAGSPADLRFRSYSLNYGSRGVANGNVRSMFEDSFGNLWLCNYGAGLEFISHRKSPFRALPYFSAGVDGFDNKVIWSVFADYDGALLLGGTNSIGVCRNGKIEDVIYFTPDVSHPYVRVTTLGRGGKDLLVGLYDDGLLRLDRSAYRFERIDLGKPDIGVNVIFNDRASGSTLIGCSEGLLRYEDGKARYVTTANKLMGNVSVTGIARDGNDRLWVSTFGNGVFIFDKTFGKAVHIGAESMKSATVNSMCYDSRGWMWVLTNKSLCVLKNPEKNFAVTRLKHPYAHLSDNLRAIAEDSEGRMWFSTDAGLHVWLSRTGEFMTFPSEFNLPNFNDRAVACDSSGNMVFAGSAGAHSFTPDFISDRRNAPKVEIVECTGIDGNMDVPRDYIVGEDVRLSHDSSLRIVFSVADYAVAPFVEYAVMLEGVDTEWSHPSNDNHVVYRNLAPGKYNFKVRARMPNEPWDDANLASMGLVVSPPLWNTWWAKIIYLLLIGAGIFIWIKYYKKRLNLRTQLEMERKNDVDKMELNEERLRFYTNITHELRTPLTLILGPLEDLVADSGTPVQFKEKIKIIHGSALRLLNLINQLLEFRKMDTQNRRLHVCRRNLADYIIEIGLRYKELNRNNKVNYVFDIARDADDNEIYFDPEVIFTVLNNLLSNAVKYTPEGTITLSLFRTERDGRKYVNISVADTGYGIESKALPHIFDRYYQAEGKYQASGTGIGLALVKSLSELHEGILDVKSTPGKGTVFTLSLLEDNTYPQALHTDEEAHDVVEEEREEKEADDTRPTVLVVEDNDDIREYISGSLSKTFRVIEAADGKEGFEAAVGNNPDIIVTDLMMPVMDGLELLSKVKEDIRTSHIPVVLLTARDSLQDREKGYDCGADSYLTKPFSAKLLNSRINNLLAMRSQLASRLTSVKVPEDVPAMAPDNGGEMQTAEIRLGKFDREFLDKFTSLVEANMTKQELDMTFVQESLNMSHSTLYRKIKGLTGMSGKEFIRKLRLRHSAEMLADGCPVSEAAYESGFNDMGYFRTCFKEEFGMSPSQYAKTRRQNIETPPRLSKLTDNQYFISKQPIYKFRTITVTSDEQDWQIIDQLRIARIFTCGFRFRETRRRG